MRDDMVERVAKAASDALKDYEKRIREKVWDSGVLTHGEWVYLVGVFNAARKESDV